MEEEQEKSAGGAEEYKESAGGAKEEKKSEGRGVSRRSRQEEEDFVGRAEEDTGEPPRDCATLEASATS